jgi:hypothetical protein
MKRAEKKGKPEGHLLTATSVRDGFDLRRTRERFQIVARQTSTTTNDGLGH